MNSVEFNDDNLAINAGIIRVYNWNPETKEYSGFNEEHLTQGIGLPAFSCVDEPPAVKTGVVICRLDGQWQYVKDLRGQKAYNKQTAAEVEINELGELSDTLTLIKPKTEFDYWDGSEWVTDIDKQNNAIINNNKLLKGSLLSHANEKIAYLQDAVDLEIATDEEIALLKEWKKYRVLLNRLDVSDVDVVFPEQPDKQ